MRSRALGISLNYDLGRTDGSLSPGCAGSGNPPAKKEELRDVEEEVSSPWGINETC